MRNFIAKNDGLTIFEGTLFADGKVSINAMPPAEVTMTFPSMQMAETILGDFHIEWLSPWGGGWGAL